jgi:flagellar protein FliO/FliZ
MSFFDIVKAFVPLILIVGLLYAVLYFVRKNGITIKGKKSSLVKIEVLSTQSIIPKKYISVVRVQDKFLVLGISDNSVSLLKEIEGIDENILATEDESKDSFLNIFKKNIGFK